MKSPRATTLLLIFTLALLLLTSLLKLMPLRRIIPLIRLPPTLPILVHQATTSTTKVNIHQSMKMKHTREIHEYYLGFTGVLSASTIVTIHQTVPSRAKLKEERSVKHTSTVMSAKRKRAGAVLIRDLYVAGHARAHPELCPAQGALMRLVILVSSAPSHASAREAVRLTWGHASQRADVALGFVLGHPPQWLRTSLEREDALYGDLIESRFVDSYSNLTLKTLSMLEWMETYCPHAPRFLKTDDDMFINVDRLLQFVDAPWRRNVTNRVWGKLWKRSRPARSQHSKYYVPHSQFPGSIFPVFAAGPAYLMTADAARRIYRAAPAERYLQLEDVLVTGVLATRLGVYRIDSPDFYNKKVSTHPCVLRTRIAFHKINYTLQFDLWRNLHDRGIKCVYRKRTYTSAKSVKLLNPNKKNEISSI